MRPCVEVKFAYDSNVRSPSPKPAASPPPRPQASQAPPAPSSTPQVCSTSKVQSVCRRLSLIGFLLGEMFTHCQQKRQEAPTCCLPAHGDRVLLLLPPHGMAGIPITSTEREVFCPVHVPSLCTVLRCKGKGEGRACGHAGQPAGVTGEGGEGVVCPKVKKEGGKSLSFLPWEGRAAVPSESVPPQCHKKHKNKNE